MPELHRSGPALKTLSLVISLGAVFGCSNPVAAGDVPTNNVDATTTETGADSSITECRTADGGMVSATAVSVPGPGVPAFSIDARLRGRVVNDAGEDPCTSMITYTPATMRLAGRWARSVAETCAGPATNVDQVLTAADLITLRAIFDRARSCPASACVMDGYAMSITIGGSNYLLLNRSCAEGQLSPILADNGAQLREFINSVATRP